MVGTKSSFLIWDGDCAFCARCVKFIEKRITTSAKIVAFQKAELTELGLTEAQCSEALQWVFARKSTLRAINSVDSFIVEIFAYD